MDIRIAEREHVDFIVQAQLAMARETEDLVLQRDTVHAGVSAVLAGEAHGFYVLALEQGAPVACTLVLDEWSDWRNGVVWWIHSVYVVPEQRRRGAFAAIFGFLEHAARERGVRGLRLYVDKRNARAQGVYRALGMSNEHYELFEKML